jgi:predicted phosphodiesterase
MKKIIFAAFFVSLTTMSFADIVMQPYLQAVSTNSIYVLVEATTTDTVTVNYGLTISYGSTAKTESYLPTDNSPVTYVHRIRLFNLQANTKYYYNAIHGGSTSSGSSFWTAVMPGTGYRFAWMADCRSGPSIHDQIAVYLLGMNPKFSIYGGDLCYASTYSYWKSEFFTPNEIIAIKQIPFFGVVGNHEGWTADTRAFEQNPASPSGTQDYYSFDYGDVHFAVINFMIDYSVNSPQYNYFSSDLAATNKIWKIVISHNPAYCSGGHGEDPVMITWSQNLFVPNHVDMVISGHSHFYQHNLVSNIHHVIVGTAGAPFYVPTNASYTIKSIQTYCYTTVDVSPNTYYMKVFNNNNSWIDTIILTKPTGIKGKQEVINDFKLNQNYPNPFNPSTTISFELPKSSNVKLRVFDISGKTIATLISGSLNEGKYEIPFDGTNLSSGVYLYKLETEGYSSVKKMILSK